MTSVLEQETVEPQPQAETQPETPAKRTRRPIWPVVRTIFVTVLLVGVAAAGGTYVVTHRLAESAYLTLDDVMLTAEPLKVGATSPGLVTQVLVTEQTRVTAGQELARVKGPRNATEVLRAPVASTVSKIDIALGGVVDAGEPVITLYDHAKLGFQAKVSAKQLRTLRLGMTAAVTGPGLARPVQVTLDHVQPRVGPDPLTDAPLSEEQKAALEQLTIVFVPREDAVRMVSVLVPGLRFTAEVDTKTAAGLTPAVNSAG